MKINSVILKDLQDMYSFEKKNWDKFEHTTVMITGGYGMIASYLVWMLVFLNEKYNFGIKIIVFARNLDKLEKQFGLYCKKEYFFVYEDFIQQKNYTEHTVDYIFHAASLASPQFYQKNPVNVAMPNALGTYELLEYARNQKNLKAFVFFSSGAVYGKTQNGMFDENMFGELDPVDIRSCYAESKRMGETWCKCYSTQYEVPCKIVRLSHSFGPTMDIDNDKRVFSEFVKNAVNNENIVIKSDGRAMRPFCYITDCIIGIIYVALYGKTGEAYNVNRTDGTYSIRQIAEMISNISNGNIRVVYEKRDEKDDYIESINNFSCPDNKKLTELGWKALVEIYDGFERTINAQKEMRNLND